MIRFRCAVDCGADERVALKCIAGTYHAGRLGYHLVLHTSLLDANVSDCKTSIWNSWGLCMDIKNVYKSYQEWCHVEQVMDWKSLKYILIITHIAKCSVHKLYTFSGLTLYRYTTYVIIMYVHCTFAMDKLRPCRNQSKLIHKLAWRVWKQQDTLIHDRYLQEQESGSGSYQIMYF
jgi:hypothetical protein